MRANGLFIRMTREHCGTRGNPRKFRGMFCPGGSGDAASAAGGASAAAVDAMAAHQPGCRGGGVLEHTNYVTLLADNGPPCDKQQQQQDDAEERQLLTVETHL